MKMDSPLPDMSFALVSPLASRHNSTEGSPNDSRVPQTPSILRDESHQDQSVPRTPRERLSLAAMQSPFTPLAGSTPVTHRVHQNGLFSPFSGPTVDKSDQMVPSTPTDMKATDKESAEKVHQDQDGPGDSNLEQAQVPREEPSSLPKRRRRLFQERSCINSPPIDLDNSYGNYLISQNLRNHILKEKAGDSKTFESDNLEWLNSLKSPIPIVKKRSRNGSNVKTRPASFNLPVSFIQSPNSNEFQHDGVSENIIPISTSNRNKSYSYSETASFIDTSLLMKVESNTSIGEKESAFCNMSNNGTEEASILSEDGLNSYSNEDIISVGHSPIAEEQKVNIMPKYSTSTSRLSSSPVRSKEFQLFEGDDIFE